MKQLRGEHGIVCRRAGERFGYFGWATVALLEDGVLLVASSGQRTAHACPWGKTVLNVSGDDGRTWSSPRVIQDSLIDDRDAGIVSMGGRRVLVTWFRSDTGRRLRDAAWLSEKERKAWAQAIADHTDATVEPLLGSWAMVSEDGGVTWGEPIRVPVSAPHGPIRLSSGSLLYLGKCYGTWNDMYVSPITAARSDDGGRRWRVLGTVPLHPGTEPANYHEPHVVELPSGRLVGMIRFSWTDSAGVNQRSMLQTESDDGGATWATARPLGFHGCPPHLLRHSSGVLVLTYGYRLEPYGQRVALSRDDGRTWDHDWILRDDGPDGDLGYPSTVELADGSLLSVYYQKAAADEMCSLHWSRWPLPSEVAVGSRVT